MRRSPRAPVALCAFVLAFGLMPGAHAASTKSAFVRINQLGYPTALPKQAFVMASVDEAGAPFSVVDVATRGAAVFPGTGPASAGSWSSACGFVHPLDFTALQTPGRYTIVVGGTAGATSPRFRIGTDAALYRTALADPASFY